ncbi:hypothetical protein SAURM35S_07564 [Streptomyces aurantiogriseus]
MAAGAEARRASGGVRPLGGPCRSTVSHHMKIMREAGITSTRAVGRNRCVQLRHADPDAGFPGLLDAVLMSLAD